MGRRTYTYDGTEWVGLTSTTADLSNYANLTTTPVSGFRNKIINGGFDIWQRGTSFTSSGSFTADRFFVISDATFTASRQTFTAGELLGQGTEPTYFHRFAKSAGGGYSTTAQKIESVRTFAGTTFTVSFWAKANTSQVLNVRPRQDFGSGGSASVTLTEQSVTLTSTWTRYKFTFTAPSIAGKTIGANDSVLIEIYTVGSGAVTWDIWGVQAEQGTIATPFEQRPIGTELDLCRRYYERYTQGSEQYFPQNPCNIDVANRAETIIQYYLKRTNPVISSSGQINVESCTSSASTNTTNSVQTLVGTSPRSANLFLTVPSWPQYTPAIFILAGSGSYIEINAEL